MRVPWVERNAPLVTIAEQTRLADVMVDRGWAARVVRDFLPLATGLD